LFNVLGPKIRGTLVIDLFAGTGAMSFESLSRGASRAILIERRFPNVKIIQQSADSLGVSSRVEAAGADAFTWAKSHAPDTSLPWLVFVCPPYDMHITRRDDMLKMIRTLWQEKNAPPGSVFVVESDDRFSPQELPDPEVWDIRRYPPAVLSIALKA
jgi:16S rRNA (guanine966-N2)-methyltransferase